MSSRIVVCALLALPAGWLVGVLVDRVPERAALFTPLEAVRLHGRYLAIQVLVLVLFAAAGWRLGELPTAALASYLFLFGALAALAVIDLEHMRLPDLIVVPSLVTSAAAVVAVSVTQGQPRSIAYAAAGAATYFSFLLLVHLVYPRGMGFGDVKLAALMGWYLGWLGANLAQAVTLTLWAMLVAFVAGSVVGLALLVARRRNEPMPFGPFLALGAIVVVLVGPAVLF